MNFAYLITKLLPNVKFRSFFWTFCLSSACQRELPSARNGAGHQTYFDRCKMCARLVAMQIDVDLPDDINEHADPAREALEAFVIAGYRSEKFTHYQASQLLGMTRFEFDSFPKARGIYDHAYS